MRTGELLSLRYKDLEASSDCAIVSLATSKSGLRTGAHEAIAIRDKLTLDLLNTLLVVTEYHPGDKLWPWSGQSFRAEFSTLSKFFRVCRLKFKPYSMRRGGATFLLQEGMALESILIGGRWKSVAVARLYLEDGLSLVPSLRIHGTDRARVNSYANKTLSTAFKPF